LITFAIVFEYGFNNKQLLLYSEVYFLTANFVGFVALSWLYYRLTTLMEDYHNFMYQRTKV
jgi:hypothetical protein